MCAGAKGLNLSKFERLCKKFGMLIATVGGNLQHAAGNAKRQQRQRRQAVAPSNLDP